MKSLILVAVFLLVSCGSKAGDPEVVSLESLKAPNGLEIFDQGGGKITLKWFGVNNEKDFDGYNVYGMVNKDGVFDDYKGSSLKLLDEAGEPDKTARDLLSKFNYSVTTKLTKAAPQTDEDGEEVFKALPIHILNADSKPDLPSVKQTSANGYSEYVVENLEIGAEYCFLVLSSIDEGNKVSQSSSNMACIVPKFSSEFTLKLPTDSVSTVYSVDLRKYLSDCIAASKCSGAPATDIDGRNHTAIDHSPEALYFEDNTAMVSGKNAALVDLGERKNGFTDFSFFGEKPAALVLNEDGIHGNGYASLGASIKFIQNHVYVIAISDKKTDESPTKFFYHYLYVKGSPAEGADLEMEMRLSPVSE